MADKPHSVTPNNRDLFQVAPIHAELSCAESCVLELLCAHGRLIAEASAVRLWLVTEIDAV